MSSVDFQSAQLATPPDTTKVAVVLVGQVAHQQMVQEFLVGGVPQAVDAAHPLPVTGTVATGGLTDTQLRATPVPVSGTVSVTGVATAANQVTEIAGLASIDGHVDGIEALLAGTLTVTGTVAISGSVAVTGPLTDAQLRATPVPVSGTVSVTGVATAANQVTEIAGLASIDGHVDGIEALLAGTLTVTGPLTDTQLRAAPVPVSGTVAVTGGLTDAELRASPVPVSGTVSVTGVATAAKQDSQTTLLAGGIPAALGAGGGLKIDGSGTALPVSGTISVTGVATAANQATQITAANSTNTLLAGGLPAALATGGGLKTDMTTIVGTAPSTSSGNKDAGTLRVTLATDQVALTNALLVTATGNVAAGATDSGNPVKVGGKYNSTLPTFTNGQRGDLQLDPAGNLRTLTTGFSANHADALGVGGTFFAASVNQVSYGSLGAVSYLYNGTNLDLPRNNLAATALASSARTATTNSSDLSNLNGRGVHVIVNVTASGGAFSIVPKITGKDPISGTYYDILVGTAITSTGITILKVYPGIGVIAGGAASDIIPRTWRVTVTPGDATSVTYSVASVTVL